MLKIEYKTKKNRCILNKEKLYFKQFCAQNIYRELGDEIVDF